MAVIYQFPKASAPSLKFKAGEFNRIFIAANESVNKGNFAGLAEAIQLFLEILPGAGEFSDAMTHAITFLKEAAPYEKRAKQSTEKGWGPKYWFFHYQEDLESRNVALRKAWAFIEPINDHLISKGLGWNTWWSWGHATGKWNF